jgi:aldose sugar dehydrogenase
MIKSYRKTLIAGVGNIVFGEGFGGITDLEVDPDGNLYVVSIGLGSIYQISPS